MKMNEWGSHCLWYAQNNQPIMQNVREIARLLNCCEEDALLLFTIYNMAKSMPISDFTVEDDVSRLLNTADLSIYSKHKERDRFISYVDKKVASNKMYLRHNLYGDIMRFAFPARAKEHGVVFTPEPIVDFIVTSVNDILERDFSINIKHPSVNIIDPFAGTGLFLDTLLHQFGADGMKSKMICHEINPIFYYLCKHNLANKHGVEVKLCDTFNTDIYNDKINVVISNPPYLININSFSNQSYPIDDRLRATYIASSTSRNVSSLYDAYYKAYRWASDIVLRNGGLVGFISNGSWLYNKSGDGFRRSICNEFTSAYILNLRGNARSRGRNNKEEGGKIFDDGCMTTSAISILVHNKEKRDGKIQMSYHDIGKNMSTNDKFNNIIKFRSVLNPSCVFEKVEMDKYGDITDNRRDDFYTLTPLCPSGEEPNAVFTSYIRHQRDSYIHGFRSYSRKGDNITINNGADDIYMEPYPIYWRLFSKKYRHRESEREWEKNVFRKYLRKGEADNLFMILTASEPTFEFSLTISNIIPDPYFFNGTYFIPLYSFTDEGERVCLISDYYHDMVNAKYNSNFTKEDIFYYVFAYLSSLDYEQKYTNNLKKSLPRVGLPDEVSEFSVFVERGRKLADLHINYEKYEPCKDVVMFDRCKGDYTMSNVKFGVGGNKRRIIFNKNITLDNIPDEVYSYQLFGKSLPEWFIEYHKRTVCKKTGIIDDPNVLNDEHGDPKYLLRLLMSLMTVSLEINKINKK